MNSYIRPKERWEIYKTLFTNPSTDKVNDINYFSSYLRIVNYFLNKDYEKLKKKFERIEHG